MDNPPRQPALRIRFSVLALILVTAFGTGESAAMSRAPTPPQVMRDTFVGCTWGKVQGATLSVWSYACDAQHGDTRLVADDSLPGFRFPGGKVAIAAFSKPAGAPIKAILTQVRAASPGPHSDTCALVPIPGDHGGRQAYDLAPTGAAKAQWDAFETDPNPTSTVEPPCGFMGPGMVGDRYFETLRGHPEIVVFIEAGSELQIFDADTLKPR